MRDGHVCSVFRKIATYGLSIYAATLLSSAISFAVTMVVARHISKEALGTYGFYVTIYSLFGMIFGSGVNQALVKFLGNKAEDRQELHRLVLAAFWFLALLTWPAAAFAFWMRSDVWGWGLAAIPFFAISLLASSTFRAEFAKGKELALRMSVSLLNSTLTLAFIFLAVQPELAPIRGDFLSIAIPGFFLVAFFARISNGWSPRRLLSTVRGDTTGRLLRFAVPLAIAGLAFVLYANASSMLIRTFVGLEALGEYYFALQLMMLLEKPMVILANLMLAGFSNEPDISTRDHRRLVTFNMTVFPLVAIGLAFGGPTILRIADFVLGPIGGTPLAQKYASAPMYVSLFALATPGRCVEFLVSTLAIARGMPQVNRNTHVTTTCVGLPILTALVWWFGPWGAAAMPLIYQVVFLSVQRRQLLPMMPEIIRHTSWAASVGTGLAAAALGIAAWTGSVLLFFPCAAAYVVGGHLLGGWDLKLLVPGSGWGSLLPARFRTQAAA